MNNDNKEIADLRRDYTLASLDIDSVDNSPIAQFKKWFDEAVSSQILEPNALVLATSNAEGQNSQRTVLMKALDTDGFVFYTNYSSRKAEQMALNNKVSMLFPWYGLERQVSIEGYVEKISRSQSLKYFLTRPHGSQLGAWVSNQSSIITSRSILEGKLQEMKTKFSEGKVPLPDFWGGFKVIPHRIEFWQGRSNRLHDRILYTKTEDNWKISRLAP